MDLKRQQWHEDTLKVFGIRLDMLAEIRSNAEVYGHMAEGPLKGVPIAGMLVPRDDPPSVAAGSSGCVSGAYIHVMWVHRMVHKLKQETSVSLEITHF